MKAIKILIYTSLIVFYSCSDYLDSESMTTKTTSNYYETIEDLDEALTGCYDALQLINSGTIALPVACDVMSDLCFGGIGVTDDYKYQVMDQFDISVLPSATNLVDEAWEYYYKGVYRCNVLIGSIEDTDWGDEAEEANEIEGEARFLRAYFYLDMVRAWENIPLLTEPSNENIPQADPDEVYELIAEDLLYAIEHCRSDKYSEMASTEFGHATRWAAQALLARAYLFYTGYYGKSDLVGMVTKSEVLAHLEELIAESGHGLVESYYNLWPAAAQYKSVIDGGTISETGYAGEVNEEVVFAIRFTYLSDYDGNTDGNHWIVLNGIRNQSIPEYGYGYGWGACTVLPEVYEDWDDDDDRKDASVLAIEEEDIAYNEIDGVKEYTGYFTKKYVPLCDEEGKHVTESLGATDFMIGQYQDYFTIRFADVLLMAAELGSENALEYVNRVHTRSCPDALASANKYVIFEERKLEFAFEGIRYWDMLRYESSLQYASDAVSFSGTVLTEGNEVAKEIDGQNLIKTKGLFQIPKDQITLSDGVLIQNDGW